MCSSLSIEHVDSCIPITALKEVKLNGQTLILQSQGPFTLLLNVANGSKVATIRTFKRQEIHGYIVKDISCKFQQQNGSIDIVAWGGRSVKILRLEVKETATLVSVSEEFEAPDRILDACPSQDNDRYDAYFVTGHNAVLGLEVVPSHKVLIPYETKIWLLTYSVKCTLYSADIVALSNTHVLVAAGTVFGDIVVWSCYKQTDGASHEHSASIHHFFTGHEGSIFGVDISPEILEFTHGQKGRLLTSCSDDRTIRIWDISDCDSVSSSQLTPYSTDGFELRKTGFTLHGQDPNITNNPESCLARAWGHESRIWAVKFLPPRSSCSQQITILSRGEDATCQSWRLTWDDSNPMREFHLTNVTILHSHAKKNIWAWDVLEKDNCIIAYTGGADGAVRELSIGLDIEKTSDSVPACNAGRELSSSIWHNFEKTNALSTSPIRAFAFISEQTILAITTAGKVLVGEIDSERASLRWKELLERQELRSNHCITGSSSHGVGLIGNSNGAILLYNHEVRSHYELIALKKKPMRLFIVDQKSLFHKKANNPNRISILATYLSSEVADLFIVCNIQDPTRFLIEKSIEVHLPSAFQVSCATLVGGGRVLIVGGKLGGIAIYDLHIEQTPLEYVYCERREHSKESVLVIDRISSDRTQHDTLIDYVLTCGRDGFYCVHELKTYNRSGNAITIERIHRSACSIDMAIVGAYLDPVLYQLILYGFRASRFISWNESTQTELMSLDCGGAKRNWAFQPSQKTVGAGIFLWVRGGILNVLTNCAIHHRPVVVGGHGRELRSVSIAGSYVGPPGSTLIATGAQDSTIRIYQFDFVASTWLRDRARVLHDHTTGAQQVTWSNNGKYLFTGAGIQQFFVWRVRSIPMFGVTAVLDASSPKDDESSDLRVMSFDLIEVDASSGYDCFLIALAFSNSTVKVFLYTRNHGQASSFALLARGAYTTNCIFHLRFIRVEKSLSLLTGATDGHVTLWNLSDILESTLTFASPNTFTLKCRPNELVVSAQTMSWSQKYALHQSSIKALDLIEIAANEILLVTGGDDNALTVSTLCYSSQALSRHQHHLTTVSIPDAHASAINTAKVLSTKTPGPSSPLKSGRGRDFLICSCGNDHRFKVWSVRLISHKQGPDAIEITQKVNRYTPVADVSCLDTFSLLEGNEPPDSDRHMDRATGVKAIGVILGGVGMEMLKINIGESHEVEVSIISESK